MATNTNVRFVPEADLRAMSQYCIACERTRSETRLCHLRPIKLNLHSVQSHTAGGVQEPSVTSTFGQ